MEIFTIGHSNIGPEDFVRRLKAFNIKIFVDVRSAPGSKTFPWFNIETMWLYLSGAGIRYIHIPQLGGHRPKQKDIDPLINDGWENPSFKNYADYSLSDSYEHGIDRLVEVGSGNRSAYGCCESDPWRCHRLLISNTLAARGHVVRHIFDDRKIITHKVGMWGAPAAVENGTVTYPSDKPIQLLLPV